MGDLEHIAAHLALVSEIYAEQVLEKLERRASTLSTHPLRERGVPELAYVGLRTWRELIVYPYRVVYRVGKDSVDVLGVFDGRRDLEEILLERLLRDETGS